MGATAIARRWRIGLVSLNSMDILVWFDNPGPASPNFQIVLNGVIVLDGATFGQYVTLSFIQGINVLQVVTQDGGLDVTGLFLAPEDTSNVQWQQLYILGSDPIINAGGGGTGGPSSAPEPPPH